MREYGYRVTGDTGRVAVTNKNIKVKSFILTGAALSSATITNKDGDNIIVITQDTDIAGGTVQVYWEQRINGLNVQLSAYAAVLNVIVE
jgi:nitrogen fixation protein